MSSIENNVFADDTHRDDWVVKMKHYDNTLQSSNKEVTIKFIASDGVSIWCLGHHIISWKSGLKSEATPNQQSLNLSNPGFAESQAAPPAVEVEFNHLTLLDDDSFGCFVWWCDDPDVELTTWAGLGFKSPPSTFVKSGDSPDVKKTYWEGMEKDDVRNLGYDQGTFTPWGRDGTLIVDANAVDSDEGYATTATMLDDVSTALRSATGTTVVGWAATIGGILAKFAADKLRADEEPDAMNSVNPSDVLNYSTNLWGGKNAENKSLSKQWPMQNSYYKVTFTVTLKTRN